MRNYIILNGVNSNTITGLLISELPPITKPKMRTRIEEIDGRNGDIVTELGYSAYTKTIEIGLYGDYDINEVIAYFNNQVEGNDLLPGYNTNNIVFSNEPDKVYNYDMLDQIDFERLIRFKTAKVRIHVQPFKYDLNEDFEGGTTSLTVTNKGNIYSKPIILIEGTGIINISLNNEQIFQIDLGEESSMIVIMSEFMEAINPATMELANRQVTGDYSKFRLPPGQNTITLSGDVVGSLIYRYSRWL